MALLSEPEFQDSELQQRGPFLWTIATWKERVETWIQGGMTTSLPPPAIPAQSDGKLNMSLQFSHTSFPFKKLAKPIRVRLVKTVKTLLTLVVIRNLNVKSGGNGSDLFLDDATNGRPPNEWILPGNIPGLLPRICLLTESLKAGRILPVSPQNY